MTYRIREVQKHGTNAKPLATQIHFDSLPKMIEDSFGIPAAFVYAHGKCESGLDSTKLCAPNNFFGIKKGDADVPYHRACKTCTKWRVYGSAKDGFIGYANYLKDSMSFLWRSCKKDADCWCKKLANSNYCPGDSLHKVEYYHKLKSHVHQW